MQLSKIKISGFKSFVDPTTIALPSNLVAIVGPNGCGKSNIIDAVTWVMGESSPKYLRGESLTDVIFNGSGGRKPVGQASVELVFDNTDGTIGGEYASYAEISVKRTINRDSESVYYLNNTRCRRRDIKDIFDGTGLGPRSYSIVGQSMIAKMIEAKPEELRAYIDEAAGNSKYKERRRETELRMNHTRENLARVNDVCAELDKQLGHLKHQANVAEKFKSLKEQERVLRAELYAIQWRHLDSKMVEYTLNIQREETALEARNSEMTNTDRELEHMRHEQRVAQDGFQEIQRRYYAVGNEITRSEQEVLHHQERLTQWENDLKQTDRDWQIVHDQLNETEEQLRNIEEELLTLTPQSEEGASVVELAQSEMLAADDAMQQWQQQWDAFNQGSATLMQRAEVEKTRISHLEQKREMLEKRQAQLVADQQRYNFYELDKELNETSKGAFEANDRLDEISHQLATARQEIQHVQQAQQDALNSLDKIRSDAQRFRGQQASLEALQKTALGQKDDAVTPWTEKHQLASRGRLAQQLVVEQGWEQAVEKTLGFALQAICVNTLNEVTPHLAELKSGNLCVFNTKASAKNHQSLKKGSLLGDKIKSQYDLSGLTAGIYAAESLEEALALCEQLEAHESVVTRDGLWLNASWLRILRNEDPAAGVFAREQELKSLAERIAQLEATQETIEEGIEKRKEELASLELKRDELQTRHQQMQAKSAQLNAHQGMLQQRITELKTQSERITQESNECHSQVHEAKEEHAKARLLWQEAMAQLEEQASQRDALMTSRDQLRQRLQMKREEVNLKKEQMHGIDIKLQTNKSQKSSLMQTITRLHTQMSSLNERKISLQGDLSSMPPIDSVKKALQRSLDKHVSIEVELNSSRVAVESLEQEFGQLEEKRQTLDREINKLRSSLEHLRVEWQGWKVKSESLQEQIKETEFNLEDVLKQLPEDTVPEEWQGKLDQVVSRIARLGPINLMAIEEYATCQERKGYLDKQVQDLTDGLQTLEEAIAKIDRESRQRFKETFDKVNERFQELFPTIFGGGKAYLELTSDNLLETGITMMACPPGKRNSTIYLLSGGEKSLTAIALIFSIFHLNPAPFCMLDEVDAALDDANVVRFTRLVKAMSDKTQFIFISHNKITIEMGEHLMGVTMNEPGVSRLVSVDVEKAVSLAGA